MGKCYSYVREKVAPEGAKSSAPTFVFPLITPNKPPKPEGPGNLPRPPSTHSNISGTGDSALVVSSVDLRVKDNAELHDTSQYDVIHSATGSPVLRRGASFRIEITFDGSYNKDRDIVCLVFTLKDAATPSYAQGSMVFAPVVEADSTVLPSDGWQAKLVSVEDTVATVEVTTTPSCIVGEWILEVDTKLKNVKEEESKSLRYTVKNSLYILFNPWCKKDAVYMSDSEHRKEYVLSPGGLIWRGTNQRLRPCVWNYGQFEADVLQCSIYLLSHISKLSVVARSDPVKVVRHISAVVNSPDDSGVLVGNWSGDYGGGSPPTQWGGSVAILQQYYKTKKPVKYGQCWVFSGVVTTICRALGIPSRCVTNFASAHDTHTSLTIDYFYDNEGEPIEDLNIDSVWNFHVWNEVWMERPDLEPGGYSGWQAIDATPQEESDGQYRCGPCSVAAIKRGEIQKAYDCPFILAEVNADKVYWRFRGKSQPLKLIQKKTGAIGQFISTKAVGSYEREDITSEYKFSESSTEEREVMFRALRQCGNAFSRYYLNDDFEDVQFDFQLLDDIVIGSPFNVKLSVTNKSQETTYTVTGMLRVDTALYTGELKKNVKKDKFEVKVEPGKVETVTMAVSYNDYARSLVDQASFNIAAMAQVSETGFDYFAQDDFRVRKPDIKVESENEQTVGKEFKAVFSLKNPLPKPLKKAYFIIEGPGLSQPLKLPVKGDVAIDGTAEVSCNLIPKTIGEKNLAGKFVSKELDDVDGYLIIRVKEPEVPKPTDGELTN